MQIRQVHLVKKKDRITVNAPGTETSTTFFPANSSVERITPIKVVYINNLRALQRVRERTSAMTNFLERRV